jgi:hypothetical protein
VQRARLVRRRAQRQGGDALANFGSGEKLLMAGKDPGMIGPI